MKFKQASDKLSGSGGALEIAGFIMPAVGVAARGFVAILGALAIMLARGTAVGLVAWREKEALGNVAAPGAVVPAETPGIADPVGGGALPD
jgi:hypothetical protein